MNSSAFLLPFSLHFQLPKTLQICLPITNKLAIYLQSLESNLFIDKIAKELVNNSIIPFTVHDSFIIPGNLKDEALSIIKSVFNNEIGVVPTFHIENLNN